MIEGFDRATMRREPATRTPASIMSFVNSVCAAAIVIAIAGGIAQAQDASPATASGGSAVPASMPSAGAAVGREAPAKTQSPAEMFNFNQGTGPVKIKSDKMSFDQKQKTVTFSGHVHADRGDGVLTCDRLRILFTDEKLHDISQMIADNNVRISQGARYATSDHAVMDQVKHTVVLTGNPVVHDGADQIAGTRITVDLNTEESVVEGARAVIFPRRSENADNITAVDHVR